MSGLSVINRKGQFTIDSREVAEMTEVRHSDLLEKINVFIHYLENGNFRSADFFVLSSYNTGTRNYPCYLITRKGCDMIANKMTGEKGVLFTAAYVTKFEQMERRQHGIPQTFAEALRLAADLEEERQKLLPKAEAYDTFMDGTNLQTMGDVAKCLGIGRNKLFGFLRDKEVMRSNNTPYQSYIDRGYFDVKEKPIVMGDKSINYAQTFVTAKGVDYISKLLSRV